MVSRTEQITTADGIGLRVVVRDGDPEALTFLLVHGLASNARMWDGVAELLAAAGHPSLAVDLRSHGRSDRVDTGFDFATLARDLAGVVDGLAPGPVVAAGQSWGGNVVLELAVRYPGLVSALCLVDGGFIALAETFPDWSDAERILAPPVLEGMARADLEAGLRVRFAGWPESGIRAQLANFETLPDGTVRPHLTRARHMAILRELWLHRPDALTDRLGVPVLVVAAEDGYPGKRDRVEGFTSGLDRGRVAWVDAHHDVHAQRPELVAGLLLELAREA